jgi:uncharacterized protein YlxW (UPF0749 family)
MKKFITKLMIMSIYVVLGFSLAYQFKTLSARNTTAFAGSRTNDYNILNELEDLKNEKLAIEQRNNDVLEQINRFEQSAANQNYFTEDMKKELDDSRIVLGMTDVEGQGIKIYLNIKPSIFNTSTSYLTDDEITYLLNELYFGGAEAISINDTRITIQSSIKMTKDNSNLLLNNIVIPVNKLITIKAIGDKDLLDKAVNFPSVKEYQALSYYDIKTEKSDLIRLPKYINTYNFDSIEHFNASK